MSACPPIVYETNSFFSFPLFIGTLPKTAKRLAVSHDFADRLTINEPIVEFHHTMETIPKQFMVGFVGRLSHCARLGSQQVRTNNFTKTKLLVYSWSLIHCHFYQTIDHCSVIRNASCTTATSDCMRRCCSAGICWCRVQKY